MKSVYNFRLNHLLNAFIGVHRSVPNARLVLAGPDEHGRESRWRERVREAGLDQHVMFAGNISGKVKQNTLARADLFCLPSKA